MPGATAHALVICDASASDPNAKITLYGTFDRITVATLPAVHPQLSLFWRCRMEQPGRVSVAVLNPDGSVLAELPPTEVGTLSQYRMAQGIYNINGIRFVVAGEHHVVLRHNQDEILRIPLFIQQKQ